MTLIVSLRIPDGIVIAGDSLATMMGNLEVKADINVTCPQCSHQHVTPAVLGGIPLPSTTLSYAQKVFPFVNEFGVGTFGIGQLTGKTIYFAMRELEKELVTSGTEPKTVSEAANVIADRAHKLLKEQMKSEKVDINTMPPDWKPLGFQVVGYNPDGKATTVEIHIGHNVLIKTTNTPGITATGQTNVIQAIGSIYKTSPQEQPMYDVFSLQDAITYAEFVISTTASHQRFARTQAGVGGEIDIALVTPFDHFRWIRQKSLQEQLSGGTL